MEMLDPLEAGDGEPKIIMEEIHIKGQTMESDEEGNVEHLSPQTLLETPDQEVQYSLRFPEGGMITYRVQQVEEANTDVSTSPTNYANSTNVPQVLTSNINGQLYVIGSPSVFTTQSGTRAIAPRSSIIETNNTVVSSLKKRDERRRATHNEVERRRRDKINNWISKLANIIPDTSNESKSNSHYDGQSKGGILAKACDYILDLRSIQDKYESLLKDHQNMQSKFDIIKMRNAELERENKELKTELKKSGVLFVTNTS